MEGHLSQGGMVPGVGSYGGLDLQSSVRASNNQHQHQQHTIHHHHQPPQQQQQYHHSLHEGFPLTMGSLHNCDQTLSMVDYAKSERAKNSASDEAEPSFAEEGFEASNEAARGKKGTLWQRVKWTDKMVKLLITAVSYIGDDPGSDPAGTGRRKSAALQKKGKWKSVSKVLAERGYQVSPQQCEDKFNDLNKRYKRLNDMLGRGTSCQVVENPALLDVIDYLNEKEKDDVKKILSSKHLFYEEMCSYHNGNRLHLPHDPALQRSLQIALSDDPRKSLHNQEEELEEEDHDAETDDQDELEDYNPGYGAKRYKPGREEVSFCPGGQSQGQSGQGDGTRVAWLQRQWMESRSVQLEERKLQIQAEMLGLEKQRLKWQRFSKKRDRELEKFRMENERMRLENEHMALELKQKEMGSGELS